MINPPPIFILKEDVDLSQTIQPNVRYKFHLYPNFEIESIYINSIVSKDFDIICQTSIFSPFITFSFANILETKYFIFVCQNLCSVTIIDNDQHFKSFLSSISKAIMVPTKKKDMDILKTYIENPKSLDEEEIINSRFDAKELRSKYFLINELSFDNNLTLNRFLFLSSLTLFNFFLRRNYFPTSSFNDPSFLFPPRDLEREKTKNKKIKKLQDADFLKIRIIGNGTHGVVTLAVHKTTGFLYAIKTIINRKYYKAGCLCFEKNIHSRIIHCYGVISQGTNKAFVLDFMSNGSLEDKKFDDPTMKTKIIYQILLALDYLHSYGLVHCDIKPSSIVLNRDFDAYLTGFSHVRDLTSLEKNTLKIGTLSFLAPEIVTGKGSYSFQADLYSFGVLIYEFTTGKKPYEELTLRDAIRKGAVGDIDRLQATEGQITKLYDHCTISKENNRSTSFILRRLFESEQLFYANAQEDIVMEFIESIKKQQIEEDQEFSAEVDECLVDSDKRKDFEFILNEAQNQNPTAQYYLGLMYLNGWIVDKNNQIALEYFSKSADQNYALALFEVASIYHKKAKEFQINFDYQKAFNMYKKAAEQNSADSLNGIGELYLEGKCPQTEEKVDNFEQALNYFIQASDKGNHYAQCNLGKIFLSNERFDIEKSLKFFKLSASYGNAEAEVSLAKIYSEGKLVPKDDFLAAQFYRRAIYHDRSDAMKEYGKMLLEGRGVQINENEGKMWILKAEEIEKMQLYHT